MELLNYIDNNKNFYPTPPSLIEKMLQGLELSFVRTVLEPSAGKGDLLDGLLSYHKDRRYSHGYNRDLEIDCIEIDPTLQATLKGKKFRLVHDDFLNFDTQRRYDLIIMNPPFSDGDKHLLKALKMQSWGGNIICLLNAETLKNAFSNTRKDLVRQIEELNANIEFIKDGFIDAERKTSVEVALIKVAIQKPQIDSEFYKRMRAVQEEKDTQAETNNKDELIHADFIKAMVQQYNVEAAAGVTLINEYNAMKRYMYSDLEAQTTGERALMGHLLDLKVKDSKATVNEFLHQLRYKYWRGLFNNKQFTGRLTSNLSNFYFNEINNMAEYEFSYFNIKTIQMDMTAKLIQGVEDTIIALFDEFSHKHYYSETSNNIHYYNGWKTNKSYKINKKIIIPLRGWCDIYNRFRYSRHDVAFKLEDITKVFDYLDFGQTENVNVTKVLNVAEELGNSKNIQLKYFTVTFYKKGTCHIEFTNLELLEKFNLYGSQRKGWLPPHYGKKPYSEMDEEEKAVVKEFSGSEENYMAIYEKQDYYIVDNQLLLGLTNGE